jgi:hypothetical protein
VVSAGFNGHEAWKGAQTFDQAIDLLFGRREAIQPDEVAVLVSLGLEPKRAETNAALPESVPDTGELSIAQMKMQDQALSLTKEPFLQGIDQSQNHDGGKRGRARYQIHSGANCNADGRHNPDRRGSRETFDDLALHKDGPGSDKTNAGDDLGGDS